MPVLKYPIGIITLFLTFGIITGHYLNIAPGIIYTVSVTSFLLLVAAFLHAKKSLLPAPYYTFAVLLFSFCLGTLTQSLHYGPNQKLHYSHLLGSDETVINGVISERLKPNEYQERYYLKVTAVNQKTANGKLLVNVPKDNTKTPLIPGDALLIVDTPAPITKPLNPYQFDYASYMEKQGIFHQLKLKDNYIKTGTIKGFDYYLASLREKLINSFSIHHFSPQVQNTLNALLLGQRQDMDSATNDAYKDAGVLHILAISGLHFSVLFYLLTIIFKPVSRFSGHGKLLRLITVLSILWGFAFITGFSASVVRSVIMFTVIGIGQYLNRDANIYNSLFISMLLLLVGNPYFIFDAGFQLSYLAVFAIVLLQPFYKRLKQSKYKGINYFGDTLLVSLAAQIGVLPLSLYYFNQFPLLFLVANLVVIPSSNIILVLGLLILLLNFIWTDAAILIGKLLGSLVEIMNGFISWIASFESLVLKEISFTFVLMLLLYGTITLFTIWLYKKSYKRTIALLCSIFIFQCAYSITAWQRRNGDELVVFNNRKSTILTLKTTEKLTLMSNDSLANNISAVKAYAKANFSTSVISQPLQNIVWFNNKKILVIDKEAVYSPDTKPDILILTQSPKINLERLIAEITPKEIIADATNYKNSIKFWKATCAKEKIPFHATAEKGSYTIR